MNTRSWIILPALSIFIPSFMKSLSSKNNFNEDFWSTILSQDEEKVRSVMKTLDPKTINYINRHLNKMKTEEGWHSSQKASASFALQIIKNLFKDEE